MRFIFNYIVIAILPFLFKNTLADEVLPSEDTKKAQSLNDNLPNTNAPNINFAPVININTQPISSTEASNVQSIVRNTQEFHTKTTKQNAQFFIGIGAESSLGKYELLDYGTNMQNNKENITQNRTSTFSFMLGYVADFGVFRLGSEFGVSGLETRKNQGDLKTESSTNITGCFYDTFTSSCYQNIYKTQEIQTQLTMEESNRLYFTQKIGLIGNTESGENFLYILGGIDKRKYKVEYKITEINSGFNYAPYSNSSAKEGVIENSEINFLFGAGYEFITNHTGFFVEFAKTSGKTHLLKEGKPEKIKISHQYIKIGMRHYFN